MPLDSLSFVSPACDPPVIRADNAAMEAEQPKADLPKRRWSDVDALLRRVSEPE
jgi:hypothetical protein